SPTLQTSWPPGPPSTSHPPPTDLPSVHQPSWPCTRRRQPPRDGPRVAGSDQVTPRHTRRLTYRCFLPDLAGLVRSRCAGPGPPCRVRGPGPQVLGLGRAFSPAAAGCGRPGTASSPPSTATFTIAPLEGPRNRSG